VTRGAIRDYITSHPNAVAVLSAAIGEETAHAGESTYLGWTWYDVRAYPATLMRLVVDGIIRVNFKSNSQTCYLLTDREGARAALAQRTG
jgi:hypothetical protein